MDKEDTKMAREVQAEQDRAEIKVKLIENGVLVKIGSAWYTFKTWEEASAHIGARIEKLKRERDGAPSRGC